MNPRKNGTRQTLLFLVFFELKEDYWFSRLMVVFNTRKIDPNERALN